MGIIQFILLAAVLGLVAWAITTYVPMPAPVKQIIIVAVCIVIIFVLINALGLLEFDTPIPHLGHR